MRAQARFKRTMRRLSRRADRLGLGGPTDMAGTLRAIAIGAARDPHGRLASRAATWGRTSRKIAKERSGRDRDLFRRDAWLFERAADAVARLRGAP